MTEIIEKDFHRYIFKENIKELRFIKCNTRGIEFENILITDTEFIDCALMTSGIFKSELNSVKFEGFSFTAGFFVDSTFKNCQFIEIDLSDLRISNCNFYNCVFINTNYDWSKMQENLIDCIVK